MANYYNMPKNSAMLVVENVVFPISNATYFNITLLNPSNSILDVNVTAVQLIVQGTGETYNITATEPSLPFQLKRGTEQTFKCKRNWSDLAGETVKIEPVAENALVTSYQCSLPNVRLKVTPNFEDQFSQSVEYFNLTIENLQPNPLINLTISKIHVFGELINNTLPMLPYILRPNENKTFMCLRNWEDLKWFNVSIRVETIEGYESTYVTNELPGALLYIKDINFDYNDTSYFNLTIASSEFSTASVEITKVNLTLADGFSMTLNTTPPLNFLPITVAPNKALTIKCHWNWSMHRNEKITVTAYTKQKVSVEDKIVNTPPEIIWNITDVQFEFDNTEFFTIKITNMVCSLHDIIIKNVTLNNKNVTIMEPSPLVQPGASLTLNCSVSWRNLINTTATVAVTVVTKGQLQFSKSVKVEIPPVKLRILNDNFVFGEFTLSNTTFSVPYINVTVYNSNNSLLDVTITKILLEIVYENDTFFERKAFEIDGALTYPRLFPEGYVLAVNKTVTFVCLSNWSVYLTPITRCITVTVYTSEGFQASRTWYRPL